MALAPDTSRRPIAIATYLKPPSPAPRAGIVRSRQSPAQGQAAIGPLSPIALRAGIPAGRRRPIVAEPGALPQPEATPRPASGAISPGVPFLIWLDTKTYAAFREASARSEKR